jgi:hypothetical protein
VHRIQGDTAGAEPLRNLAHVLLAVGVVKMLARSEDFDGLRAAAYKAVKQSGMQPLLHVDVGGHCLQHYSSRLFP